MNRLKVTARTAAVGLTLGPLIAVGGAQTASAHAVCTPEKNYKVKTTYTRVFDGIGTPYTDYNGTAHTETTTTTVGATGTIGTSVSGTVTAKGGVDLGVVTAGVDASTTASVTASRAINGSHSVTITIDPKHYGVAQYGDFRIYTAGTYTTVDSYCNTTSNSIKVKTPQNTQGYDTAQNTTGDLPWD